jgi:hypothetical protein
MSIFADGLQHLADTLTRVRIRITSRQIVGNGISSAWACFSVELISTAKT